MGVSSEKKDGFFVVILKGAGCFLLGVALTASHYVFDLIAAPLGTIVRTIWGCIRLYIKTKPKGFFQHLWFVFKSLFLVIYNLIKLPFLLVYRATFGLIEHAVGITGPMMVLVIVERGRRVLRGKEIQCCVDTRMPIVTNKFEGRQALVGCSNLTLLFLFAVAFIEFESPLFNDSKKHGKVKKFFTGIWNKVHGKFGEFAEWLSLPKIDSDELKTTVNGNHSDGIKKQIQILPDAPKEGDNIFNSILHPVLEA